VEVEPVPPGVVVVPPGVVVVPPGVVVVPPGVVVVPPVSAGEVVPAGESAGEAPPPGVSDCGWQADSAVIKPSINVTIIFDLTVKILTIIQFSASILSLQQR